MKIHSLKVRPSAMRQRAKVKFVIDVSHPKAVAVTLTFAVQEDAQLRFLDDGTQDSSVDFHVQLDAGSNLVTTQAVTLERLAGTGPGANIELTLKGGRVPIFDAVWIDFAGAGA